jgi:starch phosphorylase
VLDPDALTIGFARRFATYKRATLILHDIERLRKLLTDPARPVQVILAGKAHPRDNEGKELIRQVASLSRDKDFGRRFVFLEGYDLAVARYLVQGVDVWLNNPLRPQEASGTSGMKAAANGVLNFSTLDGWWDEVWRDPARPEGIGWAIGHGETYEDRNYQDQVEAEALYDLLERDVIPTFYDRGVDRVPRKWVARMKASIGTLNHFVNTHRMVSDYTRQFYLNAHERYRGLESADAAGARDLAAWMTRVEGGWSQVRIEEVLGGPGQTVPVGANISVRARVRLGSLAPGDVAVELYFGPLNAAGEVTSPQKKSMQATVSDSRGNWLFEAAATVCCRSGLHGYTVRVLPRHPGLASPFIPGLIAWAPLVAGAQAAR